MAALGFPPGTPPAPTEMGQHGGDPANRDLLPPLIGVGAQRGTGTAPPARRVTAEPRDGGIGVILGGATAPGRGSRASQPCLERSGCVRLGFHLDYTFQA